MLEPLGFHPALSKGAGSLNYTAIVRLKTGVTLQRATAELRALIEPFIRQYGFVIRPILIDLRSQVTRGARTSLWLLLGAVFAGLLIVCANVGNLMLVRTAGRYRDAGVRLAQGAGRARLFGQVLKEALVLVVLGGALGLVLSYAGLRLHRRGARRSAAPRRSPDGLARRGVRFCRR